MSRTQTGAPLAPLPHKTFLLFSYPLPPFPRSSPTIPIFPDPSRGSVPPPYNHRRRKTTFVTGTGTKIPLPAVSHTPRRTSPYVPTSPQQPTYAASSPSRSSTLLKSVAPNLGPSVGQTCHTEGTGGGADSSPPGLLCFSEVVGEKSVPGVFSVRTMSLGIPPQGTSIRK